MSALPPALDFAAAEEEICKKWADEETFKTQDKLSVERGDEVSSVRTNRINVPEDTPLLRINSFLMTGIHVL